MRPSTVLVVHPEVMVAEAITSALAAFPGIVTIAPAMSASEADARIDRVVEIDAAAVDQRIAGRHALACRLREHGVRVVVIGDDEAGDEGVRVPTGARVAALAAALVPSGQPPRSVPLSAQQTKVLSLVARGMTAREVARHLGISPKTVEQHKARIFQRLGVPNQAAAVRAVFDPAAGASSWVAR